MITQYDVFGRVTQTGWKNLAATSTTRKNYQANITSGTNPFTLTALEVLTKNYYDNYSFAGAPTTVPTTLADSQLDLATNVKGLQTGTWVKVLDNASSTTAEISYTLYDKKYRPVRSYTKNHLGGYTQVDTNMDWAGRTIYTITKHKRTNAATELLVKDMFTYSPQDKLLVHKQKINALPEQLINSNTYDELGQLTSKNVGGADATGAAGLQKVDYAYNIRGWLKEINKVDNLQDDLFAFKINYNDADTATDLFNGNISETYWKTSTDNKKRKYDYKYDDLNRLLQADYSKQGNTAFNSYLEHLWYDKNGNIKNLLRNGGMDTDGYQFANPIDNLTYLYDADNKNQLLRVFDATANPQGFKDDNNGTSLITEKAQAPDYGYDANGNMIRDDNKGIKTITYNHLNLPTKITFANPNNITYLYNAVGQKLGKVVTELVVAQTVVVKTDYLSGFQYVNDVMQFFPHAEGYVKVTGTSYDYVYNYTDHLGNIRLSYSKDPATNALKVIEENHYYPFGLKHTGYNSDRFVFVPILESTGGKFNSIIRPYRPAPDVLDYFSLSLNYDYKFENKEWQDELSLNLYDFGGRLYDPAVVRTTTHDPLAEKFYNLSPQSFLNNNPMYFVDPTGMATDGWIKQVADGVTTMTYNPNVNTVEEATAANYKNVKSVGATGSVSSSDGSYSYSLNADGSVTDGSGNRVFGTDKLMTVTTSKGTEISSFGLWDTSKGGAVGGGSGACIPMDFSSPFFNWGWAIKGIGALWSSAFGTAAETTTTVASGSVYSVAYETTLSSELFPGLYRGAHFKAANTSLSNAMASDAAFSSSMSSLGVSIPRSATGTILGKSPTNWVWHHSVETGVMQLVPKVQHTQGSIFWNTMHPNGVGGYAIWGK
jgi:RHS repeat-associated protein